MRNEKGKEVEITNTRHDMGGANIDFSLYWDDNIQSWAYSGALSLSSMASPYYPRTRICMVVLRFSSSVKISGVMGWCAIMDM